MKTLLIIQARMGSTRLPGKVLKSIKGRSLLGILIERIKLSMKVDKIVVASTTNKEDDAIESYCTQVNVACFRGSDWDVLDRYYKAAKTFDPETVVRITSDCPLHHHKVIDFAVDQYEKSGLDYFSNSNHEPDVLEDGFDVEVFSFKALEEAWKSAKLLSEREHVTPYIKNSGKFTCGWKKYDPAYNFKLSVDTEQDFKAVEAIFNSFDSVTDFGMEEVVELLKQKAGILELNKDSVSNAGYRKSIENDGMAHDKFPADGAK